MKLELKKITKSFSGKPILHDVSFTVENGKPLGFLGRNGAGKTTTIRILMDIFGADSGEILMNGKPFNRKDYRIGYLPEERGMYQKVKILDQLVYFGELKGLSKELATERSLKLLESFELLEYKDKLLETLSKGNQQKVQIMQVFLDDPDIVILDEPFSGLDPVNANLLKKVIVDFIGEDKILIFSSHQMSHVENLCKDVAFIKKGTITKESSLASLKSEYTKNKYELKTSDDIDSILEKLGINFNKKYNIYKVETEDINKLVKDLLNKDIELEYFKPLDISLEEIFIRLDGGQNETV